MQRVQGMVGEVSPDDIIVGERERKVYRMIEELAADMELNGVISPPAIAHIEGQPGKYELLAGGRRMRAIRHAKLTIIPARIYPSGLSVFEKLSIEMQENLQREDLTWQEKASGLKKLHDLQIAIYGEKTTASPHDKGWSQSDTAELLGVHRTKVSQDLALAEAIELVPELASCKTADEASKMLKSVERKMIEDEIIKRYEAKKDTTPESVQKQKLIQSYIIGDFFERVKEIETASVDFIDCDPPYGISFDTLFDSSTGAVGFKADNADFKDLSRDEYPSFIEKVFAECFRILKPTGWIVVWHSTWLTEVTYQALVKAGFTGPKGPALWTKPGKVGRNNNPYTMMTLDYEPFLYMHKGMAELKKPGRSSLFNFAPARSNAHPTMKPIYLMEDVLDTFTNVNDLVCVPFLGSGNTLLAAHNSKRRAFGFDKAESFKNSFAVAVLAGSLDYFMDGRNEPETEEEAANEQSTDTFVS